MRFWLDTEFIEDGITIDLISIGIVAEDGRQYYAISSEFKEAKASEWVKNNVINRLGLVTRKTLSQIKNEIVQFVGDERPEFWGYYCDYDWVVFCRLFGRMIDLPRHWPKYCLDIKQLAVSLGNPKLPKDPNNEHNALADARWNVKAWKFLQAIKGDAK